MSSILIIDDERQIRRLLRVMLEAENFKIFEAATGRDGLVEAASRMPDVILLDLGLPDIDGIEVLRRLREWAQIPVMILSVQDSEKDKVTALDEGADDYVTKPFNGHELLARLRAIMRRGKSVDEPIIEIGALRMDLTARLIWVDKKQVSLTPTEYSLMRVLVQNVEKIVTHKQLLTAVWGPNAAEQSQYLRVYVSHLRKKLTEYGFPAAALRTETGIGYRLTHE